MVKRLMVATALMLLVLSAGARVALAHEKSEQTVIKPRDFTIPKAGRQCSQLPIGLVVKGLGLERTTTVALGRPAARPAYSVLSNSLVERVTGERMPHWRDAVDRYLETRSPAS